ncbi:MAG: FAD binding domain-containing protein [Anaerolineales bacterium]
MKPAPFAYVSPDSLEEALDRLAQAGSEAKVIAGGQSLIPAMNFRILQPSLLIDLNRLADLEFIRTDDGDGLRIGAMTRQRRLERDPQVRSLAPLLYEATPFVAHPQIRNRGTLGGSLAHADPSAELPVVVLALEGRVRAQRAGSERWIEAADFFQGMFATALGPDEIVTEVALPAPPERTGWAFTEIARRSGDYALAGVAVGLTLNGRGECTRARIVFLNAGDGPRAATKASSFLAGQAATPETFEAAAAQAAAEIDPPGNLHASPEFQRHLAGVLARRALVRAHERASQPQAD